MIIDAKRLLQAVNLVAKYTGSVDIHCRFTKNTALISASSSGVALVSRYSITDGEAMKFCLPKTVLSDVLSGRTELEMTLKDNGFIGFKSGRTKSEFAPSEYIVPQTPGEVDSENIFGANASFIDTALRLGSLSPFQGVDDTWMKVDFAAKTITCLDRYHAALIKAPDSLELQPNTALVFQTRTLASFNRLVGNTPFRLSVSKSTVLIQTDGTDDRITLLQSVSTNPFEEQMNRVSALIAANETTVRCDTGQLYSALASAVSALAANGTIHVYSEGDAMYVSGSSGLGSVVTEVDAAVTTPFDFWINPAMALDVIKRVPTEYTDIEVKLNNGVPNILLIRTTDEEENECAYAAALTQPPTA